MRTFVAHPLLRRDNPSGFLPPSADFRPKNLVPIAAVAFEGGWWKSRLTSNRSAHRYETISKAQQD